MEKCPNQDCLVKAFFYSARDRISFNLFAKFVELHPLQLEGRNYH